MVAEKYLQEAWPKVKAALKEYGITCELNLVSRLYVLGLSSTFVMMFFILWFKYE